MSHASMIQPRGQKEHVRLTHSDLLVSANDADNKLRN